jgi:hypothetical protein
MSVRNADALRRDLLKQSFTRVPLGLKLLGNPLEPRSPSIFQMDILHSRKFGEYFRIWPGARDNEVEVLSSDGSLRQLVLRVKEPRRRFIQIVRKTPWIQVADVEERARASNGRILSETRRDWRLELWTPEDERRFLCGRDDLHLFVARRPEVYAQGVVIHPDHRVLPLYGWRRVVRNLEVGPSGRDKRLWWVD